VNLISHAKIAKVAKVENKMFFSLRPLRSLREAIAK
jgi:hypothetical protein